MTKSELALLGRRLAATFGLAALAVLAFLGIGEWYVRALNEDKTIVLDRSLFEDSGLSRIDTMIRRYSAQPIEELQTLKNGTVLVRLRGTDSLAVFDLANGKVIPLIDKEPVHSLSVSPDGTTLIYGTIGRDKLLQTVWYDVAEKKEKARWNVWMSKSYMLDDRHIVYEIKDGYLGIRDLGTGTVEPVGMVQTPLSSTAAWPVVDAVSLSPDKTRLYIPYSRFGLPDENADLLKKKAVLTDKPVIFGLIHINLNTGALSIDRFKSMVGDFVPLNGGSFVFAGQENGVEGLYRQSEDGEAPELLAKGVFASLAYDPNNGSLAYVDRGEGRWKVMVAKLDEGGLTDQFTVYDNLGYIRSLQWSADGESLIGVTEESAGSYVYQFRIK